MTTGREPVSIEELADACGNLAWLAAATFETVGAWSTDTDDPTVRVHFATASRHLGWHAELWAELLPDSPALDGPARVQPPTPRWERAIETAAATDDTVARLAALHRVIVPRLLAAVDALARRLDPVAGAPSQRIARIVRVDLLDAWSTGNALLLDRLDPATADGARAAAARVEDALVAG